MKKTTKKTVTTVTETVSIDEKTLIAAILDCSGSMSSIIEDAIGGFNEFLKNQKKLDDETNMTVALFDNRYDVLYNNVPLKEVKKLTRREWSPRGSTALYDAIGITINSLANEISSMKKNEKPTKVLVAIVTDGYENSSKEYSANDIKKLIKQKEKEDWQFVYLAADQDAFNVGTSLGFSGGNTFSYTNTAAGNTVMFDSLSDATVKYRGMKKSMMGDIQYASASANLFEGDENNLNVQDGTDINIVGSCTTTGDVTFKPAGMTTTEQDVANSIYFPDEFEQNEDSDEEKED